MHKTTHCRAPSSQKWEWQNSKIKVVSYSCIQNIIFPKLKSLAPTRPEYVPTLETTINEWRKKKTTKPISFYCWVMGFTGYELLLQYMKAWSSALENTFAQGIHLYLPDKLSKLLFYVQLSCLTVNWNNASGKLMEKRMWQEGEKQLPSTFINNISVKEWCYNNTEELKQY